MRSVIREITLKNFRAYRNQKLEFPATGFILIGGPNGSGKSSIAMAIGLGLNLRAFHQIRQEKGFKISDLVKEGEDESFIQIILDNVIYDATGKQQRVHPCEANDITIQRHIYRNRSSSGNVKIKDGSCSFSSYQDFYQNAEFSPDSTFSYVPQGKLGDLIPTNRHGSHQINYFDEFVKHVAVVEDEKLKLAHERYKQAKKELESFTIGHFMPLQQKLDQLAKKFNDYKRYILLRDSVTANEMLLMARLIIDFELEIDLLTSTVTDLEARIQKTRHSKNDLLTKKRDLIRSIKHFQEEWN